MLDPRSMLLLQAAATLFMTGLIWFVQVVHYPLMRLVGAEGYGRYQGAHTRRTTWVVGPPMLIEAATAVWTVIRVPPPVTPGLAWLGLGLLGVVWLSTATLQVPQHGQLAMGFDAAAHRRLVATNWVRVAAWSARSYLVLYWVA